MFSRFWLSVSVLSVLFSSLAVVSWSAAASGESDPPEVAIGERLFKEWRFSQYFYEHFRGDVNRPLPKGDPAVDILQMPRGPASSPFRGQAVSCASCHMVDQALKYPSGGMRTYADFASRTPVSARADGMKVTLRNTQAMVTPKPASEKVLFLHYDGEFTSHEDLSEAALTGRNMGWLNGEKAEAMVHIAKVIREDDGQGDLAQQFGGSYEKVLAATDADLKPELKLSPEYRLNVRSASDHEIFGVVIKLMTAYMKSLDLHKDSDGNYSGSPFDLFLKKNDLPQRPSPGESDLEYSRRLRTALENKRRYEFVNPKDGHFEYHAQNFTFGALEFEGLKIFLSEKPQGQVGAGACLQCHAAPHFTDFLMHNTAVSQFEYDQVHGEEKFNRLFVPTWQERLTMTSDFKGFYSSVVNPADPRLVDLGLWGLFADPAHGKNQRAYRKLLEEIYDLPEGINSDAELLPLALGLMKTPTLRDLGHSNPYFHNGFADSLESAVRHYVKSSTKARRGEIRNADPRLAGVNISEKDIHALVAFLKSLNEDYD